MFKQPLIKMTVLFATLYGSTSVLAADFRDASWGMSLRDVLALHPGELPADRKIGYLAYEGKLARLDMKIFYRFDSDGLLYQAGYLFKTDGREDVVLDDYERLNELLRKRYPNAEAYEKNWSNDLFTAKPGEWARAVRIGHLEFDWQHEASGLLITHSLRGSRREISHVLEYEASSDHSIGDALEQL